MVQSPMISCPLKDTNEIDWIQPLKSYIRHTYGDDPERYSEECATLNRLRQDMRGAGRDSATGRDLLYRYYGQLELLDLRFPVDENHIKISFTWYDAFTRKATSQYSLAYEKASIIFNISAVLSCHAANQSRSDDTGLKTAYHSFQASAGMFTYINDNFLHAPSTDLSRDTVKTLIAITLAQAQEVFLEKQVRDEKKPGFLAKLASQAAHLYSQASEGVQENVTKGTFEKVWATLVLIKASHLSSVAGYYQAIADDGTGIHGVSIGRLKLAEKQSNTALGLAKSFPSSVPAGSNLNSDTGPTMVEIVRRHLVNVQEKLVSFTRDNDYIYHQPVPSEASLSMIAKLPAAKAIPVSELYQGQDIQRIIGPDIFQKIVPMSVTESASLYDEEKAKLVRAEVEKVEAANGEMAAGLDFLKLPGSLNILKGSIDQELACDEDFRSWCAEVASHQPFRGTLDDLQEDKITLLSTLEQCSKQLDMEESVCEKMRSKYGADWTQQPSSRLTATLRSDIRTYRGTIDEASASDSQLLVTLRQYEGDFEDMHAAGESGEADVLFQQAMIKAGSKQGKGGTSSPYPAAPEGSLLDEDFGEGTVSVSEQITRVEELLRKLNLVKRDRMQTLKDLKDKVHNDDISNVLILNKKSIANQEEQLFQAELEKFRPHQTRLLQANHKQTALMKELAKVYGDLLQDKRVRAEQSKYETLSRQRNSVISKYRKVHKAFKELLSGLDQAQTFYMQMKDTVDSLKKNVDTFLNNRRSEGAQLLNQIERDKSSTGHEDREREKLKQLMERLSMEPTSTSPSSSKPRPSAIKVSSSATKSSPISPHHGGSAAAGGQIPSPHNQKPSSISYPSYPASNPPPPEVYNPAQPYQQHTSEVYNPMAYFYQTPTSPPPGQQYFSPGPSPYGGYPGQSPYMPQGYVPPPPPPRPHRSSGYNAQTGSYMTNPGVVAYQQGPGRPPSQPQGGQPGSTSAHNDPWAGLNAWK
ncbi:bck1-like resistance to osmotic shock [Coccidioides posadasii str. Silveira]|uniref:BRO domain-containing protein 1 n=2 Tax=Coccidioides posadasii TaxID=199306 RepID=E9DK46_COCPS|nr:Bro1-like domain containing protein [Coccidioides posadasii C735 delta SOWgp]EER22878.1 Bro1-like domain containing protein [Coccidioides posadasii C735 delta SOWgp]EFW13221.1 vacuolar protein-sorting protein bro1 [Coccidioides posadasii str. Silveira]QVM09788.1 bck1-like resistance to osmotic shock [Coccidioides posadasii str. Silveira]|eukprot:XP_003065023.1 Bro1-like domain containing protein [Coccidioides posadasii C735 delta SOWgp]